MSHSPDVMCIGQAVIDCITRGQEDRPYKENVWRAETIRLSTGGDAVNEAFSLASSGYRVSLVCGLGKDLAGSILLSEAGKRGISTENVTVSDTLTTPIADLIEEGYEVVVSHGNGPQVGVIQDAMTLLSRKNPWPDSLPATS